MSVDLEHFLTVGALLFALGLAISLGKRNAIGVLMGIELMLNAVNLTLLAFARFNDPEQAVTGHVFVVFVVTVAAAEAAVALALALAFYRNRGTVEVNKLNLLKS